MTKSQDQTPSNEWHWLEQDTLLHAFDRVLKVAPGRVFLDFSGAQWTYAEFDRLSTCFAHSLRQLGVRPGDTVMTVLDNNVDAVTSWFAINKIGAISVPINTALRGEFLRHQLNDAGGSLVVCEAAYLPRIIEISEGLPAVRRILARGVVESVAACQIPIEPLDVHRGTDDSPIEITAKPSDTSCIIYTSGTTGPSKGSMQSYNYFCHLASQRLACKSRVLRRHYLYTPAALSQQRPRHRNHGHGAERRANRNRAAVFSFELLAGSASQRRNHSVPGGVDRDPDRRGGGHRLVEAMLRTGAHRARSALQRRSQGSLATSVRVDQRGFERLRHDGSGTDHLVVARRIRRFGILRQTLRCVRRPHRR